LLDVDAVNVRQIPCVNLTDAHSRSLPADATLDDSLQSKLSSAFGIPTCTWTQQYRKATGYFLADEVEQSDGWVSSCNTSFRFLIKSVIAEDQTYPGLKPTPAYEWTEIGFWTQWKPSHSSVLLCMIQDGGNFGIWDDICQSLQNHKATLAIAEPFDWHRIVIPIITQAFDRSVWLCRDRIRQLERNRPAISSARPQYAEMHEIARHTRHISETLSMSINVLEGISREIRGFEQTRICREWGLAFDRTKPLRLLNGQKTLLECALGRSQALTSRLQKEINLVNCSVAASGTGRWQLTGAGVPHRRGA
jgi:hypothetical protein